MVKCYLVIGPITIFLSFSSSKQPSVFVSGGIPRRYPLLITILGRVAGAAVMARLAERCGSGAQTVADAFRSAYPGHPLAASPIKE